MKATRAFLFCKALMGVSRAGRGGGRGGRLGSIHRRRVRVVNRGVKASSRASACASRAADHERVSPCAAVMTCMENRPTPCRRAPAFGGLCRSYVERWADSNVCEERRRARVLVWTASPMLPMRPMRPMRAPSTPLLPCPRRTPAPERGPCPSRLPAPSAVVHMRMWFRRRPGAPERGRRRTAALVWRGLHRSWPRLLLLHHSASAFRHLHQHHVARRMHPMYILTRIVFILEISPKPDARAQTSLC